MRPRTLLMMVFGPALILVVIACGGRAPTQAPEMSTYAKYGLSFEYPKDMSITEHGLLGTCTPIGEPDEQSGGLIGASKDETLTLLWTALFGPLSPSDIRPVAFGGSCDLAGLADEAPIASRSEIEEIDKNGTRVLRQTFTAGTAGREMHGAFGAWYSADTERFLQLMVLSTEDDALKRFNRYLESLVPPSAPTDSGEAREPTPAPSQAPIEDADVAAIAAGGGHTCVLTTEGGVICWGQNNFGQLGNGTSGIQSIIPVSVVGLETGIAAITAGFMHTCALTTGGGVKCWGQNRDGQLGNGTTTASDTPTNVMRLNSGVAAIAAGGGHTCAVTTAGGVKCWGESRFGQLGAETTDWCGSLSSGSPCNLTPVDVTELTAGVGAVAAAVSYTCALTTAGGVKCWGLGFGDIAGPADSGRTPMDVVGLDSGVAAVVAGFSDICVLTTAGGVQCGAGFGAAPIDMAGLESGVSALVAGFFHTCALTTEGGIECWGQNRSGQLGDGTTTDRAIPVDVPGLASGVAAIAAGTRHTCAVTTAGGVKCWGHDDVGQLGTETTELCTYPDFGDLACSTTPVDVVGLSR